MGITPRTRVNNDAQYILLPNPRLDITPAESDTMLTAMVETQRLTNMTGQAYTIFTNDQQLYRVVVNITWVCSDRFQNFIPRLGGMHTLMNFAGALGSLMVESGRDNILQAAFSGVPNMLYGNYFLQNIRVLRLLTEKLLRGVIIDMNDSESYSDLMQILDEWAIQSSTTRFWVYNIIEPVFIMMMFVRSEREADWPLHLWSVQKMIPYFFAAGHFNYAR